MWIYETQYNEKNGETFKDYIENLGVIGARILAYQFTEKYDINIAKIGSEFWHISNENKLIYHYYWEDAEKAFSSLPKKKDGSSITIGSYTMTCIKRSDSYFLQMINPSFKRVTQVDAFISENRFDEESWGKVDKAGQPLPPFCRNDVDAEWLNSTYKRDLKDLDCITEVAIPEIPLSQTEN